MNTTPYFHHPHLDLSAMPVDVRARINPNLPWSECYSVGFRVSTKRHDSFVHALIFADSFVRLQYGIDQKKEAILALPFEQPIANVDVVYVRNMVTLDRDAISESDWNEFEDFTKDALRKRDDGHYVVYGIVRNQELALLEINSSNAITAILQSIHKRINALSLDFTILEVRQAHPAAKWFESMFHETARRMSAIEELDSNVAVQLH